MCTYSFFTLTILHLFQFVSYQISPLIISNKLFLCENMPIKISLQSFFFILSFIFKTHCISFDLSNFHFQIQAHYHHSISFYIQLHPRLISRINEYTVQQHCILLTMTHESRESETQSLHTSNDSRVKTHEKLKPNHCVF